MLETLQKVDSTDKVRMDDTWSQSAGNVVSWLGGFTDGEGCIGLSKLYMKKDYHIPSVQWTNTHKPTIERVFEILSGLGVSAYIQARCTRKPNPKWKPDYFVMVRGLKRVSKLLPLLIPHLYTKRPQAEIVMEFVNLRLSVPFKTPYGPVERELIEKLHRLNKRGPSETTRVPHES